jgi:hypothetical protein
MSENESMPQGAKQIPSCISIVICNEVIEDRRTNNKTLVSLFNGIVTPAIPCVHPRMFIMASLIDGIGDWPITLRITGPSDQTIVELKGTHSFGDPLSVNDLIFELHGLPLNEEGVYIADVFAGGRQIAARRFFVHVLKAPEETKNGNEQLPE